MGEFWDQSNGCHHGMGLRCSDGSRRVEVLLCGCLLALLLEHLPSHLVALPLRGFKNPEPNTPFCLNYLSCPSTRVSHERGLTFPLPADELLVAVWCGLSRRSASPQEPAWALLKHCLPWRLPRIFPSLLFLLL